jgi:curli biogenesis system outer membrane secretion channel CsgG
MTRAFFAVALALALAGCGQAPTSDSAETPAAENVAAAGDPCSLVANTAAVFGREVTAAREPMPNMCQWRSADAVVTGSIIVHGAGWSAMGDAQTAYDQMASSLASFGATQAVSDLGDQAVATGPGSQVQIVFRKGGVAANVGASSSDPALTSAALADRIARAAADRL